MSDTPAVSLTRRQFVRHTGVVAGGALLAGAGRAHASEASGGLPKRTLGRTGADVTTLTLGTAPCGQSKSYSARDIADAVDTALELGVNSVDTAPAYGNAEEGIGLALGARRTDVFLATKVWADTVEDAERSLANSLRMLKTDHVDLLYFHNLGTRNVDVARSPEGVFTWLEKQKQLGKTRFVGLSGHNLSERFRPFIESDGADVVLIVLNFVDRFIYGFENTVLPLAQKHNLGVVAMKVFGGIQGGFRNYGGPKRSPQLGPQLLEPAVRYALGLPGVASLNIGVHDARQVRENVAMVKRFQPLTEAEQARLAVLGRQLSPAWGPHFGPVGEPVAFREAAAGPAMV